MPIMEALNKLTEITKESKKFGRNYGEWCIRGVEGGESGEQTGSE